jgi:hypothetical protein
VPQALAGAGLLVKLTWAPVLFVLARTCLPAATGARSAGRRSRATVAVGLSALLVLVDDWSVGDIVDQVVVGQLHSGVQPLTTLGIVLVLKSVLVAAARLRPGRGRRLPGAPVSGPSPPCSLAALKNGTFFNIFDPLEPFGDRRRRGAQVWRRHAAARALAAVCCAGLACTSPRSPTRSREGLCSRSARPSCTRTTGAGRRARRQPSRATAGPAHRCWSICSSLVAHRRVVADQGDWFILPPCARRVAAIRTRCRPAASGRR